MASVGQLLWDFWNGAQAKEVALPTCTHPLVYAVAYRFSNWGSTPPFSFPEGWVNAINPSDPGAVIVLDGDESDGTVACPYIWDGGGSPGASVTVTVTSGFAEVFALQLSLEAGEVLADLTGARHGNPEPDDPLSVPGSASQDGLLVVCSGRTLFSPG